VLRKIVAIEWGLIQSAISATAGLGGVWLGGQLTSKREEARESERIKKETIYLAIFVVAHLDRFANACLHVAFDDGTEEGRPAGNGGCYAPTVTPPTFDPLGLDVNWKVLSADLMYGILGLPYRIEQLQHHILGTWEFDSPPEYVEFFWARQHGYAVLGLEVSELAQRLREHAALPSAPREPGAWNRDDQLRELRDKITGERDAYERRTTEPSAAN
jgi:hypothetical protein